MWKHPASKYPAFKQVGMHARHWPDLVLNQALDLRTRWLDKHEHALGASCAAKKISASLQTLLSALKRAKFTIPPEQTSGMAA